MSATSLTAMPYAVANAIRAASHGIVATTHTFFEHVGDSLTRSFMEGERERDEAYLAESADHFELERRLRELDYGRKTDTFWPS